MDFLYIAFQPYDQVVKSKDEELNKEMKSLVQKLGSHEFSHIVKVLEPIHNRQNRRIAFRSLFEQYIAPDSFDLYKSRETKIHESYPARIFGLSKVHDKIGDPDVTRYELGSIIKDCSDPGAQDIFGWTPLHYAVTASPYRKENIWFFFYDPINELIKRVSHTHRTPDRLGRSPIHVAASIGHSSALDSIFELLNDGEIGVGVQARGIDGTTPLHLAATDAKSLEGILKKTKKLFIRTNPQDIWRREPMHIAARHGQRGGMNYIVQMDSNSWSLAPDGFDYTPIDYLMMKDINNPLNDLSKDSSKDSFQNESSPVQRDPKQQTNEPGKIGILVRIYRKNPDWRDHKGNSFLHYAIDADNIEMARELVNEKINVNISDANGRTPLHHAIDHNRTKIAIWLIQSCGASLAAATSHGLTPLMFAVRQNQEDLITAILDKGGSQVNINAQDHNGNTVLHYALASPSSHQSQLRMIQRLEAKGSSPKFMNSNKKTLLDEALQNGNEPVSEYLLKLPPDDWKVPDDLLMLACKSGCIGAVPTIMEKWPHLINKGDSAWGQPPVSFACERDHWNIVKLLAGNENVKLSQPANKFWEYTPLHFAADNGSENSVAILLDYSPSRVNINALDKSKKTPLDIAIAEVRIRIVEILLRYILRSDKSQRVALTKKLIPSSSQRNDLKEKKWEEILEENEETLLVNFIYFIDTVESGGLCEKLMMEALKGTAWKSLKNPFHVAARIGSAKIIEELQNKGADPKPCDDDGWTWEYSAIRFGQSSALESLFSDSFRKEMPRSNRPDTLLLNTTESFLQVGGCQKHGHEPCNGIQYVCINNVSDEARQLCIQSKYPASPLPLLDYFYFEVKVKQDSHSKALGIGFCRKGFERDIFPGWRSGTWGYHGDDGGLYIKDQRFTFPSRLPDSQSSYRYSADDVAGVYLNFKTGEGFCTLNGKKLVFDEVADSFFKKRKLHLGKIYPCVGFSTGEDGVGLRFRINFGQSPKHHPFRYQGPEINQEGNAK